MSNKQYQHQAKVLSTGIRLVIFILMLSFFAGCGPKFDTMTAEQIYKFGEEKYGKKSYSDAIDAYEALIDLYPFSTYVTGAELRIADAQFMRHRWTEAEAAYDAFAKRHPTHEQIDHVIFRSGMCSYNEKMAIDRDLQSTQKAEQSFSQVVNRYPSSTYYAEAQTRLREVRDDLAARERYVAKQYWRDDEYYASYQRWERITQLYSDTKYYEEALYYGARCLIELDERSEAQRYIDMLLRKFPEGKYASKAKSLAVKKD